MDDNILLEITKNQKAQTELLATLYDKINLDGDPKTKTAATSWTAQRLHGNNGLWAHPGNERDVITAHVRPTSGIASLLPILPSQMLDPRFPSLTGYTATTGSQPTNACDDAPTGYVKGCSLTARFGRVRYDTHTIDLDDVALRTNRGDHTDLVLRGQVLGLTNLEPSGLNQSQILDIITMSEMVTVGVAFERELTRQIWQGVTTVANEYPGLDVQIATGQKDADSGTLCAALDSDVKSYNYVLLNNTIVNYLSQMEWYLRYNAMTMGLEPATWAIAMRPDLWFELTSLWPCAYNTTKCSPAVATNSTVFIDGRENVAERDSMRNGMYIDINGRRYPVVVDVGIFEHNSTNNANLIPGEYASSIYFVPLTITGGFPVTYREYNDYRLGTPDASLVRNMGSWFYTDNGVYNWAVESIKWCYKLAAKTEQRVILRTPQLAGRIDAVKYSPLQHLRESHPSSPYWVDGGVSLNTATGISEPYAVWTTRSEGPQ